MNLHVTIIGAGRAGSTVGRALAEGGAVVQILKRNKFDVSPETTLIILGVPDDVIADVAKKLAQKKLQWKNIAVAHLSGALTRSVLTPLKAVGARTLALHPAFPFSSRDIPASRIAGVGWGIDCGNRDWQFARDTVEFMKGRAIRVPSVRRMQYHAACAIVSNFIVVLEETALQVMHQTFMTVEECNFLLNSLLASTCENLLAPNQPNALRSRMTGPVSRGDAIIVKEHLKSLATNKNAQDLYRALATQAVHLLSSEKPQSKINFTKLSAVLKDSKHSPRK